MSSHFGICLVLVAATFFFFFHIMALPSIDDIRLRRCIFAYCSTALGFDCLGDGTQHNCTQIGYVYILPSYRINFGVIAVSALCVQSKRVSGTTTICLTVYRRSASLLQFHPTSMNLIYIYIYDEW